MAQLAFHAKRIIQLALPVLVAQVTQTMMGFIDTMMAGRVSAKDMAAVAIGTSLWLPAILFVNGLLLTFTPMIAHHFGAGQSDKIRPLAYQGVYIATFGAIGVMLFLNSASFVLDHMNLDPALYVVTENYIHGILWGAPAFLIYQVLRSCSEGISYTMPAMIIGFVGLAVNIPANYIFIYGHLGLPAMGGAGCGVATSLVFWAMCLSMLIYMQWHPKFKAARLPDEFVRPQWQTILQMSKLGMPVALALFFEVSLFSIIALLLAPLGANVVASHQIALNFSSMVFMVPLSIGIAVSIRVGYYLGRNEPEQSAIVSKTGLLLGFSLAACTALLTVLLREDIALLYNKNPQVVALASGLMLMAALYQLSDSVQVISAGALRGYKDTRSAFYITLFAYWGVGMPLGYLLAYTDLIIPKLGAYGFWCGLIAGLTTAAMLYAVRLKVIQRRIRHSDVIEI